MTEEQYLKNLEAPEGKVDVILDTDAYNEVDDQYAISLLLHSLDRINLIGITAVPFYNRCHKHPLFLQSACRFVFPQQEMPRRTKSR